MKKKPVNKRSADYKAGYDAGYNEGYERAEEFYDDYVSPEELEKVKADAISTGYNTAVAEAAAVTAEAIGSLKY